LLQKIDLFIVGYLAMRFCRIAIGLLVGLLLALAVVGLPAVQAQSPAQSWPQRPVRIIVPFPAGGSSDVAARILAKQLEVAFRQSFVVENRPGASGVLAAETVARASPDGYVLLMATSAQISVIPQITKVSYNAVNDFAPISTVATNPFVLTVHPSLPVRTVGEFVAYARAQPQRLSYASSGIGSLGHLSMELFLRRAGLATTAVSYKGGSAQLNDVIAGHVKVTMLNLSAVATFASSDALRLLATTSEKRVPQIPDVPTFREAGFDGFAVSNWEGLMAPAGTDQQIIARIAGEVARAVHDPNVTALLAANGLEPVGGSPSEFTAMIAADVPLWGEAVKRIGLKAEQPAGAR
jgi:tripartite-type tricarboxylate transporter receptor subunit TctC